MPLDPQKQIEDLLNASAKERREKFGTEPSMPGPMRTQLHAEIARMNERASPAERTSWFSHWWPRLAIAAVVTLLVSLPLYREITRQSPPETAADGSARSVALSTDELASANKPAGVVGSEEDAKLLHGHSTGQAAESLGTLALGTVNGGKVELADSSLASGDSLAKQLETKSVSAPAVVAQPVQSAVVAANEKPVIQRFSNVQLQDKNAMAASSAAIAQNATKEISEFQGQMAESPLRQKFRANLKVKQAAKVLSNFQFEQTGKSIRIYDSDGSFYSGEIRPVAAKDSGGEDHSRRAAGAKADSVEQEKARGLAEANGFYFRAEGANRSLNKSVVIEGNYFQQAQPATSSAAQAGSGALPTQSSQQGARIVGRAQINGSAEVQIDAVSTTVP